jgi:hypothetical protein
MTTPRILALPVAVLLGVASTALLNHLATHRLEVEVKRGVGDLPSMTTVESLGCSLRRVVAWEVGDRLFRSAHDEWRLPAKRHFVIGADLDNPLLDRTDLPTTTATNPARPLDPIEYETTMTPTAALAA